MYNILNLNIMLNNTVQFKLTIKYVITNDGISNNKVHFNSVLKLHNNRSHETVFTLNRL